MCIRDRYNVAVRSLLLFGILVILLVFFQSHFRTFTFFCLIGIGVTVLAFPCSQFAVSENQAMILISHRKFYVYLKFLSENLTISNWENSGSNFLNRKLKPSLHAHSSRKLGPRETESREPVAPAMEIFFPTLLSYVLVVAYTMWNRIRAGPGRAGQKK